MATLDKHLENAPPLFAALIKALLHRGVLHADDILRYMPPPQESVAMPEPTEPAPPPAGDPLTGAPAPMPVIEQPASTPT